MNANGFGAAFRAVKISTTVSHVSLNVKYATSDYYERITRHESSTVL